MITAVIPTFNRRLYLERSVGSVLSQSCAPDEIIIVDDGSTDGTSEWLASEYGSAVKVIRQENAGVSAARRRGITEAKGEWIAFLDSDDVWAPDRMAVFRDAATRAPADVNWIFGDTLRVGDHRADETLFGIHGLRPTAPLQVYDDPLPTQFPFQYSLLVSSLIRRTTLFDAGAFSEALTSSEDFLVSFRAALRGRFAAVPNVVTHMYRTSDLTASSLNAAGFLGLDHYRARVLAFREAARRADGKIWARHYAAAVRGQCLAMAEQGRSARRLAIDAALLSPQAKTFAFAAAALFGTAGVSAWRQLSAPPQTAPVTSQPPPSAEPEVLAQPATTDAAPPHKAVQRLEEHA